MANAKTWPQSLGVPVLGSARLSGSHGYQNSEMEYGTLLQRQTYNRPTAERSVRLPCRTIAVARALDFLEKLSGASFDMQVSAPGDPDTSRPVLSVRYLGRWEWEAVNDDRGVLSFDIFVEALPETKPDGYYDLFDVLGEQFDPYMQALEDQVNAALLD